MVVIAEDDDQSTDLKILHAEDGPDEGDREKQDFSGFWWWSY